MAGNEITFDDPPLNEVVLGRTFIARPDFLVPYFGGFWDLIRDTYPKVEHATPILEAAPSADQFLLPRVWYLANDSSTLVQLQQDRFHFNWRQTEGGNEYVRFPGIQEQCSKLWGTLDAYITSLTGQALQPLKSELSYVNIIPVDPGLDPTSMMEKALVDFHWSAAGRNLPRPKGLNLQYTFPVPSTDDTLRITAGVAKRRATDDTVIRLELSISGECGSDESFEAWSLKSHDFLVRSFKELTTAEMHQRWKIRG